MGNFIMLLPVLISANNNRMKDLGRSREWVPKRDDDYPPYSQPCFVIHLFFSSFYLAISLRQDNYGPLSLSGSQNAIFYPYVPNCPNICPTASFYPIKIYIFVNLKLANEPYFLEGAPLALSHTWNVFPPTTLTVVLCSYV